MNIDRAKVGQLEEYYNEEFRKVKREKEKQDLIIKSVVLILKIRKTRIIGQ